MSCDAIVYPYIDPVTGIRKWRGVGGSGDETCSSIFTGSNIVRLPVEVSLADDDGLQDGETSFCRRYGDQTPATVVLTAPDNYGDVSRPFRHWVLDGVKQEDGELSLSVLVTGEECHIVKAVYGNIVNTCREGMEWLDVATLSANLSWNVSDNPFCTRFSCPICPPDGHDVVP
ncbi:MAG: hypothetical protein IID41_07855, partial [Planctomycetes bacterium]|nr:hypothetical protein [Planctomycetota bacterium]